MTDDTIQGLADALNRTGNRSNLELARVAVAYLAKLAPDAGPKLRNGVPVDVDTARDHIDTLRAALAASQAENERLTALMGDMPVALLKAEQEITRLQGVSYGDDAYVQAVEEKLAASQARAERDTAQAGAVPECVKRWRHIRDSERRRMYGAICEALDRVDFTAHELTDCLEWLATTPTPAIVLTDSASDAEVLLGYADDVPMGALSRATIADLRAVREWLERIVAVAAVANDTSMHTWARQIRDAMPPELRALLGGE